MINNFIQKYSKEFISKFFELINTKAVEFSSTKIISFKEKTERYKKFQRKKYSQNFFGLRKYFNQTLGFIYIILAFVVSGCAYSFTGSSIPSDMKTIAIPVFEDISGYTEAGLRENLTNALIQKFIQDNSLQVVDRKYSDTILEGIITSLRDEPFVISGNEQVNSRRIVISCRVKFIDQRSKKQLWEKSFSQYSDYAAESGLIAKQQAIQKAIENLTEDILIATVSDW